MNYATLTRIALRDLRGSVRKFVIFLLSLTLGVASIAVVGLLLASARQGIADDSRSLLGGDILVRTLYEPITEEAKDFLREKGELVEYAGLRTMARRAQPDTDNPNAINAQIAELKAVPKGWPLVGNLQTAPALGYNALYGQRGEHYGAAVEQELLDILSLGVGDVIMLGQQSFEIRAVITKEPDRLGANYSLGPRILISRDALAVTDLVQFGSMVNYVVLSALANPQSAPTVADSLMETHDDGGYQLRMVDEAAPGISRALNRLGLFLTFAAITTLLIAAVGIANAAQSYLSSRLIQIARLKCLGATTAHIRIIYGLQLAVITCSGIAAGLVIAIAVHLGILSAFGQALSLPVEPSVQLFPLAVAALYGVLVTLLAILPALRSAMHMPATQLLRFSAMHQRVRYKITPALAVILLVIIALLVGTTIYYAQHTRLTLVFFGALLGAAIVFSALAWGIRIAAANMTGKGGVSSRIALSHLARKDGVTSSMTLSFGLSLTLMVTLGIVALNLYRQLAYEPPEQAPDFFVVDIQPAQYDAFVRDVTALEGVTSLVLSPMIRGRITHHNNTPLTPEMVDERVRWALQGERGITFADTLPESSVITEGEWWGEGYQGEPLVSFGAGLAEGMGIKLGDTMTFNVLGQEVVARVASLREINWSSLQMNFGIVLTPGVFTNVPPLYIGTIRVDNAAEMDVLRFLINDYAGISVIRLKATLAQLSELFASIAALILAVGGLTIIAGLLVIAGSLGTTLQERIFESLILRVLGWSRPAIRRMTAYEISYLTGAGLLVALLVGSLISRLITGLMNLPRWLWVTEIYIGAALMSVMLIVALVVWLDGHIKTARPLHYLRNE